MEFPRSSVSGATSVYVAFTRRGQGTQGGADQGSAGLQTRPIYRRRYGRLGKSYSRRMRCVRMQSGFRFQEADVDVSKKFFPAGDPLKGWLATGGFFYNLGAFPDNSHAYKRTRLLRELYTTPMGFSTGRYGLAPETDGQGWPFPREIPPTYSPRVRRRSRVYANSGGDCAAVPRCRKGKESRPERLERRYANKVAWGAFPLWRFYPETRR